MSCNLITGLPRNGKSYYCCHRMIEDLVGVRAVYTNLPINPDVIARHVAIRKYDKKSERYLDVIESVLSNIRIFRTFTSRHELEDFKKVNPAWCRLHRRRRRDLDSSVVFSEMLLFPFSFLGDYWNHTKANSIFYLDECYQIWNYLDSSSRSEDSKMKRRELQNYMRMHGHDGDDIFLITHKEKDLDTFILGTLSYRIEVKNSKYWPIIPQELTDKYWWITWLASLRWPWQFFIIRTYIGDEKTAHRTFHVRSNRFIFKCYDSQSRPNGLKNRGFDSSNFKSSDLGKGYLSELKEWFKESFLALLILTILGFSAWGILSGLYGMLHPPKGSGVTLGVVSSELVEETGATLPAGKGELKDLEKPLKLLSVTPSALFFDSGLVIRKGGIFSYEEFDFNVISVSRQYIELERDGARKRLTTSSIK